MVIAGLARFCTLVRMSRIGIPLLRWMHASLGRSSTVRSKKALIPHLPLPLEGP